MDVNVGLIENPSKAFEVEMRREWTDKRGHPRHGPLFGVSDDATALIESCQPYKGPNGARLRQLRDLWNTDKHETLIPTILWGPVPEIKLTNSLLVAQPPGYFEGDTYVMEVLVAAQSTSPPDPNVDVETHALIDIALSDGREPVIEVLATCCQGRANGSPDPRVRDVPRRDGDASAVVGDCSSRRTPDC